MTQYKYSQTTSSLSFDNTFFDRESGRAITIHSPDFDLTMAGSSLSLQTDSARLSPNKLILLLKCLLIIQVLPEAIVELDNFISELLTDQSINEEVSEHTRHSLITNGLHFDTDASPIWDIAAQVRSQIPDEEWEKLPTDLARNFDDY
ncbi:MAG: hypothetical protein AAFY76_25430 [Cyanobacteria bacterium J06649_11]